MLTKTKYLLILTIFMFQIFSGQAQEWVYGYDGTGAGGDIIRDLVYGTDGNLYGAAISYGAGTNFDFAALSLTAAGAERWVYRYNGPANNYDEAYGIAYGQDGNIYIAGQSTGNGTAYDLTIISLTPDMTERWVRRYDGPGHANDVGTDIIYGPDGNIYACGYSYGSGTSGDFVVISLTPTNTLRWVYRYNGPGNGWDYAYRLIYGLDGNLYICGETQGIGTDCDFTIISINTDGSQRWVYRYNGPENMDDWAYAVVYGSDNNIYAAGSTWNLKTGKDFIVVGLTNTGTERWKYFYSSPGYSGSGSLADIATGMIMGQDGNLYVTGHGGWGSARTDIVVLSLTTAGTKRWFYNYDYSGDYDHGNSIIYGADGNLYIAAESDGASVGSGYDFSVLSLTRFGNLRWFSRYNGPASDHDGGIVVLYGLDSKLYACGYRWVNTQDGAVIRFNPGFTGIADITTNPSELLFMYGRAYDDSRPAITTKPANQPIIEPALSEKIAQPPVPGWIPIMIVLDEQIDIQSLTTDALMVPKSERRAMVSRKLKFLARNTQQEIVDYLQTQERTGRVKNINSLWIINAIGVEVKKDAVNELLSLNGINQIVLDDDYFHSIDDMPSDGTKIQRAIVWNVQKIQADLVWTAGYTGKGIIVGVIDTGVRYTHNDLADHLWNGGTAYPNHGYDFVNRDNNPIDDNGHGTHVAGTIAGDGTSGTQTGVAPDAQIMALKVLNASGSGSLTKMAEAVQFAIDHNADVINISAGADSASNTTKNYCRDMCLVAYIAEVPMALAAGNGKGGGSHYQIPYDINTPADAPAAWYAPNGGNNAVLAVGATDQNDVIGNFSSYGPTQWNTTIYNDYPYPPGLIKPDISAPGVNIVSLSHLSNIAYTNGWNGTSMASPHLAGTIALMLEKNRFLTVREIDSLIENTALDLGAAGRDNNYGAGRINALAAVNAVKTTTAQKGTFYIKNRATATGNLEFLNPAWSETWIRNVIPASYIVGIGESTAVDVYVDTTGLATGIYRDTVWIESNDPDQGFFPEPVCLYIGIVNIEEPSLPDHQNDIGKKTIVLEIMPSPFCTKTEICWSILNSSPDVLKIYDASGCLVKLFSTQHLRFASRVYWNGQDDFNRDLPAGVYFVDLEFGNQRIVSKVVLTK